MIIKYLKYIKQYLIIHNDDLFDIEFYLENNPDVRKSRINPILHYITNGWKEGRNPSKNFDTNLYLENNQDVKAAGINPLIHYILFGKREKRRPYSSSSKTSWKQSRKRISWQKYIQHYQEGLNVIGFLQTAKGLAEVIRYNRYAYESVGLNYSLIDYEFSIPDHQKIIPIPNHAYINDFRFNTNVFHVNPPQFPNIWQTYDEKDLTGRYNIGVWYWELPELPDDWRFAFDLVDEIWVASAFVHDAISAKTEKPVLKIPPCIYMDEIPVLNRRHFNLPKDRFLFMSAYDVLSSQERKNPLAAIDAFKQAFPKNDRRVGLVIKVNNAQENPKGISAVKKELDAYNNIYYIEEILDRATLNGLINIIDVYVSLHRSEGFGLIPAEAMYLGKPVIMTNWSGNLELMTPTNACGVDYKLIKIKRDYGPYNKGQHWAEPNISHAADYMWKLIEDKNFYDQMAYEAEKYIKEKFAPKRIGNIILKRLKELGLQT